VTAVPRRLIYVHDPMCSWCWAFRPVWASIRAALPEGLEVRNLLGGLAADIREPMPMELQRGICRIWQTIQQRVPGTEYNFDFWERCRFARDPGSEWLQARLLEQIGQARRLGADGFPSLVLVERGRARLLRLDYRDRDVVLGQIA